MFSSYTQTVLALAFFLQSTLAFSQNFHCSPPTFLKTWGNPDRSEQGTELIHSSDGNLYLSGGAGSKAFVQKINFAGEPIWMRGFEAQPLHHASIRQILEDSEGMLVGCGRQVFGPGFDQGFVFRYNPVADSFLWAHTIEGDVSSGAGSILEKTPGGNFVVVQNPNYDMFLGHEIELLELERATGNIVPGFAKRYGYIYIDALTKIVMVNGALYGLGSSTGRHGFEYKANRLLLARFDPSDGTPIWAQLSHADTTTKADFTAHGLAVDGDALVAAYTMDEDASSWPIPDGSPHNIHLQKTDLDGNILWIRQYELSTSSLNLLVVPDGYVLHGVWGVFKVSKNGDFLWGRRLPFIWPDLNVNVSFLGPYQAAIEADSLYFIGYVNPFGYGFHDIFFWKMLTDGSMSDSCGLISSFNLNVVDVQNPVITPIALQHFASPVVATAVNAPWVSDSMEEKLLCPQYAPMNLACPADIEVSVGPGASGIPVNYNLPAGTSDCDCPGFAFTLTSGLSSGSLFPVENTQVCYSAEDDCGTSASCCFSVKVSEDEESPCDTKTIGCMRYDLLSITADAQQRRTYRIRATNNCSNKLIYSAIQLPNGVTAVGPTNLSTYTSPAGRNYDVRNPNFSPFYSIRFKSTTDGTSNGESDVFEYTLPAQSQPAYIHITSRLDPQLFYEAHLNIFNCPIGITPSQNRNKEDLTIFQKLSNLRIYPNPTSSELFADLSRWQGESLNIQILDSRGQRAQSFKLNASSEAQSIPLGSQLAAGLYFLEIATEHGEREVARFVLER